MRILITGSNGFIGSYLARYFLDKKHEVIASSRQFHASTSNMLRDASLVELDVLNAGLLSELYLKADVVLHAATANDIISRDSARGVELSAIGTKNILDFAIRNRIPRCVVFSTFQVYGSELEGTIDEKAPLLYQNDYGLNHVFAEMYASLFSRQGKVQTVSVRPSNVYGPVLSSAFNRWSLVPGCFCKEVSESGTITLRSSGKQRRNFIHLENLSRGLECILQHFPTNYECYNLASAQSFSMLEVVEKVKEVYERMTAKKVDVLVQGTEPIKGNEFSVRPDKMKSIGFEEATENNLESAIEQIFTYLRTNS